MINRETLPEQYANHTLFVFIRNTMLASVTVFFIVANYFGVHDVIRSSGLLLQLVLGAVYHVQGSDDWTVPHEDPSIDTSKYSHINQCLIYYQVSARMQYTLMRPHAYLVWSFLAVSPIIIDLCLQLHPVNVWFTSFNGFLYIFNIGIGASAADKFQTMVTEYNVDKNLV